MTSKVDTDPKQRLKLLFADDEKSLQELMRLELPRMGHEVTVCPDGTTAVAALQRNTYDCILVDLDMPGPGGIEVIAKAKQISPETEAIVLTGKSTMPCSPGDLLNMRQYDIPVRSGIHLCSRHRSGAIDTAIDDVQYRYPLSTRHSTSLSSISAYAGVLNPTGAFPVRSAIRVWHSRISRRRSPTDNDENGSTLT